MTGHTGEPPVDGKNCMPHADYRGLTQKIPLFTGKEQGDPVVSVSTLQGDLTSCWYDTQNTLQNHQCLQRLLRNPSEAGRHSATHVLDGRRYR